MAASKNSKDVILVNCQEIPESICVETRFITQSGKQRNIEQIYSTNSGSFELNIDRQTAHTVSKAPPFTANIKHKLIRPSTINTTAQQSQLPQQAQSANSLLPLVVPLTSHGNSNSSTVIPSLGSQLNTLPSVNGSAQSSLSIVGCFNEQLQQTDISTFNTKSVAIQCTLDEEFDDLDVEWPVIGNDICQNNGDTDNEMERFLKFIKDNSTQQKTYKECLICGELCKSNKYFYGHMAVHRGPKALCSKCGECLEHENLLPQHKCQKAKQLTEAFLKCPHFSCDVTAISLLELYDHINEHTNNMIYKCSACRKGFCTGQEFLRHILIRAKCYTSAKKKRFRLYGLESQRDRQCRVRVFTLHTYKKCTTLVKTFLSQRDQKKGVCKVCFKSIRNKNVYKRHRISCIARFKKRLIKKREK